MTIEPKPGQQFETGESDRPPFFSSWSRIYGLVLSFLAILILLFYLLTKAYS